MTVKKYIWGGIRRRALLFQTMRKIYNSTTETFTVPDGVYYIRIDYGKTTNLKQQDDVTLERIS